MGMSVIKIIFLGLAFLLGACFLQTEPSGQPGEGDGSTWVSSDPRLQGRVIGACSTQQLPTSGGSIVQIAYDSAGNYQLCKDGKPYFIKGAGGTVQLKTLSERGGNTIRTWGLDNAKALLDSAYLHGISVTLGYWLMHEGSNNFTYNNAAAVAEQKEKVLAKVRELKDHPALLAWGLGNELNYNNSNLKTWDALEDLAASVHQIDGKHPTTTVLASVTSAVNDVAKRCPSIDILGINEYGDLSGISSRMRNTKWKGPYSITEWGPTGHLQAPVTQWRAPIEQTSTQKAALVKKNYPIIISDKARSLGSYIFLWGQKQERTHTWYGLFTDKGEPTEVVDVMENAWTGKWPVNRAPSIDSILIEGRRAQSSAVFSKDSILNATVIATDIDDSIEYRWELLDEASELGDGGSFEPIPKSYTDVWMENNGNQIKFKAPDSGAFRLFVFAIDRDKKVATANFPFFVK